MPFGSNAELSVTQVSDRDWRLNSKLVYYGSKYIDEEVVIGSGFVCDGSSIPRLIWAILGHPMEGAHAWVGFLHDWLYRNGMFTRKICDLIYREAHLDFGTPIWKVQFAYSVLRMIGWVGYGKKR